MPEYLAPGVYVEEIDTGSKPIEGVSTSTAGMIGVTERGPYDVPILITSYGEYVRWFGERLRPDLYSNGPDRHCYLPQAVEGFFTNGGKRVYITRILDTSKALSANTFLFDRGTAASASTRLLQRAGSGATSIIVANGTGLAAGNWIQIGSGAEVEYQQIVGAPTTANEVTLRLPLTKAHTSGVNVFHYTAATLGAIVGTASLVNPIAPGDMHLEIDADPGVTPGSVLRVGTAAGGDEELLIANLITGAGPFTVDLRTAVTLPHPGTGVEPVDVIGPPAPPAAAHISPLDGDTAADDTIIRVADHTNFVTPGDIVLINDAANSELRVIGQLGTIPLGVGSYADFPAGTLVEEITSVDAAGTDKDLQTDATAGSNVLRLTNRMDLSVGDVVRVGLAVDVDVEYATIQAIPNRQAAPDAGLVILSAPLQRLHVAAAGVVREQTVTVAAPLVSATLVLPTSRNSDQLVVNTGAGFAVNNLVRLNTGSGFSYFRLAGPLTPLTPQEVVLNAPLVLPHDAGSSIAAREPVILARALDPGIWGNRLRVSVQDQSPALVNTRIRIGGGFIDQTHIRLDSANGIEPGTILQRVDANGNPLGTPFKVGSIDRQNGYLLTLDAANPVPMGTAEGDAVRSLEFQIDVYLLRQPDPAVPSRNENVIDVESFRNLSLDPRHSRYIHKVIGTTWSGGPDDDDGQPLRLSDRRSEGESAYVRVRDQAPTQAIRQGPEALVDILPDGRRRPTRLPLRGGEDMISFISDTTYIGNDSPDPESRTGLQSLRNIEEISIIACPGRTSVAMQNALINQCELMRYRFAVLDAQRPPKDAIADIQNQRQQYDTKYAALYHPWLLVPDPYATTTVRIPDYPIPPSGHMVGVYARTDIERGVHKAPANEVVRGITGLQRLLNKEQQDIFNPFPTNINIIRDFRDNNRGIRVYGGRCITSDSDWKYVNVRRLLIFIEASIDRGLQWVVFEPNAEPLWARVRRSISNFLTLVWRNGGLEGTKVEEAFFVKCDRTTMTQTDIDSGRLICVVGVAPVKPAEFVIVRIGLWTARADN